ncbi:MAG TPA: TM0106 family RecB-like putative nuclease [Acidimicrobiales bacterium]|nr:TM0106 family RecB-like putative nuclease [Acidimicrobiales bacterium]
MEYGTPTPHPGVTLQDVPLQRAVVATRCPVRADLDHAPDLADARTPRDPSEVLRAQQTADHVADVWAEVARLGAAAPHGPTVAVVVIDQPSRSEREARTLEALAGPARIIVGAQLPDDHAGRRRGRSILLVRPGTETGPSSGWVPVEVRRHAFTRPATGGRLRRSPLASPHPDHAEEVPGVAARANRHNENGIALAHAWRLLEAVGAVAPGQRALGGVIDRDRNLWWVDLEEERWPARWSPTLVTTLAHYDHGFGFRLEVIANRLARTRDPDVARGVVPVHVGQCATCPWDAVCRAEMEAVDHVSLIPRSTYDHFLAHRDRGVLTRAQVARLHRPTAWLMFGDDPRAPSVDVDDLLTRTRTLAPDTPLERVLGPEVPPEGPADDGPADDGPVQLRLPLPDDDLDAGDGPGADREGEALAPPLDPIDPLDAPGRVDGDPVGGHPGTAVLRNRLRALHLTTVADLVALDPFTASYSGSRCGHLPTVIDEARATVSGRPFLARGLDRAVVTRADVEVDIDMENVEEGVYLWGTLVSGTPEALAAAATSEGYQPFYSLDPITPTSQTEVFNRFWTWLTELRDRCETAGLSFAAYCYTAAEHRKMVQILDEAPPGTAVASRQEVDALVSSGSWIDLYEVVRGSLVVGHGLGLKRIAPLAGFQWRDPDAGGLQSMTWHRDAVTHPDPEVKARNRVRLLQYNEDDVRATRAVRQWLSNASIPSIAAWEAPGEASADVTVAVATR